MYRISRLMVRCSASQEFAGSECASGRTNGTTTYGRGAASAIEPISTPILRWIYRLGRRLTKPKFQANLRIFEHFLCVCPVARQSRYHATRRYFLLLASHRSNWIGYPSWLSLFIVHVLFLCYLSNRIQFTRRSKKLQSWQ